jgi:hypothetical protein
MQYDANHGTTNKPQAILLANGEIGVTTANIDHDQRGRIVGNADFHRPDPTAKGVVTVRLVSRSDARLRPKAFADTWTIT